MTSARSNVNVSSVGRFFAFIFVLGMASALLGIVMCTTTAAAACSLENELEHDAEDDSEPETEVERTDDADVHGFGGSSAPVESGRKGQPPSSAMRIASPSEVEFVPHSDSNASGKPPPR